jgi:pimeloyl-ACP methyl ester carboxylesterase
LVDREVIDRRALVVGVAAASVAPIGHAGDDPPRVERAYAPCRYGQVHLRRVAGGNANPPVLCFHQVPNSGQVFERFLERIGTDRLAIAFDTPGYGMSDPAPDPQTIEAYAGGLADAVGALGLADRPVDLIGYHTGAAIAAALAAGGKVRVRRMVLFAVPVFSAPERASFGAQPPIPFDEEGDWAREEWRRSWRWRGPGQSRESVLRTFAEKMRPGARERGARAIAAFDMAGALRASTTPLLLVRPKDDLWEATGRAFDLRPDVGHVELPDLGHGVWEVATRRVDEIVRQFLDR